MNPVLQEFIAKAKEEKRKQREKHLVSLGLIDENKSYRDYYDYYKADLDLKYDREKGQYYKDIYTPIDITDEEYEELLKWLPKENKVETNVSRYSGSIVGFSIIYLILSIICGVISFMFGSYFIGIGIALIISGVITYIFFRGFANIVEAAERYLSK